MTRFNTQFSVKGISLLNSVQWMFHTNYIFVEYLNTCFPFALVHLKVYILLAIDMFFISVRQVYTEFHAQVHRDQDRRNRILIAFIILQKRNVLLLLWVHTNKRRIFTDSKDVLLLSVWPKMREYFKSKWPHRRLHLSCRKGATIQLPHSAGTLEQHTFL